MEHVRALVAVPALIICGLWAWATRNDENDWLADFARIQAQHPDARFRDWTDGT